MILCTLGLLSLLLLSLLYLSICQSLLLLQPSKLARSLHLHPSPQRQLLNPTQGLAAEASLALSL